MTESNSPESYNIIGESTGCAYLEGSLRYIANPGSYSRDDAWRCACGLFAVVELDPRFPAPETAKAQGQLTIARRDAQSKLHNTCPGLGALSAESAGVDIVRRYEEISNEEQWPLEKRRPRTRPPEEDQE